jgi:Rad3-related DNA helicase
VFVECGSGLVQTVALTPADRALFDAQLDKIAGFLDLRLRGRDRLRNLRFNPPFSVLRPGQESARGELDAAIAGGRSALLLEAPTGFGKTGVLLEFALNQLRSGHFDRVVYLTSKSTGQLQAVRTLATMMSPGRESPAGLAVWQVRPKSEHCVNHTFHCVRDGCAYLDGIEARWPASGLARFYLFDGQARDLEALRAAGREARICPYEITRTALAFNDVWIGDYNYVFAPANRGIFYEQPGFDPARTLLIVDEAHNLAARVADAYSHSFSADDAMAVRQALDLFPLPAPFMIAWEEWAGFLRSLGPSARLEAAVEDEARALLERLGGMIPSLPLDPVALGPKISELVWNIPSLTAERAGPELPDLWWCPRGGELSITCLDAGAAIGSTLGAFGGVVLATATPGPADAFAGALGLGGPSGPALSRLQASTPWREGAYDVACDLRVDTSYRRREGHQATTAATVEAIGRSGAGVAVFFPSYAYAEAIVRELARRAPAFRASVQPRLSGLSAQASWIEDSLASADALFLVLGSSFAESIDLLGGRVTRAMVVGPALPEVNAVQKARLEAHGAGDREAAFRRVYQIPGMQKVNQALGRLVRAPGHHAKVLLHCRRFDEPGYADLLAPDLRAAHRILTDDDLAGWLR